jgi:hypothetical protein
MESEDDEGWGLAWTAMKEKKNSERWLVKL